MSQNARRHGAQSAPDKSLLLVHLKYILGYEPNSIDLQFPTPRLEAAVQLAACEARLDQAHAHYVRSQEAHRDETSDNLMECMEDLLYFAKLDGKDIEATLSPLRNWRACRHLFRTATNAWRTDTSERHTVSVGGRFRII